MIKIKVIKDLSINEVRIDGHAGYEELGKDIVCSAVSSIVITTVNAILKIDSDSLEYVQGDKMIIKIKKHSEVIDILTSNMLDMLLELEQQYKENISIN
jgi:uncharacterized protein YsxB (DUF464 family)